MLYDSAMCVGLLNATNHHTQNSASTTWVIHSPTDQLVTSSIFCIGQVTNNIVEYSAIIELLLKVISLGI